MHGGSHDLCCPMTAENLEHTPNMEQDHLKCLLKRRGVRTIMPNAEGLARPGPYQIMCTPEHEGKRLAARPA